MHDTEKETKRTNEIGFGHNGISHSIFSKSLYLFFNKYKKKNKFYCHINEGRT
jgi:hypothetical protein